MLAAPIVNPIVAFSTFAAFRGQSPWLNMCTRLVLGYLVAVVAGLEGTAFDLAALGVFPVVVAQDERPVGAAQIENGIQQGVANAEGQERR